MFLNAHWPSQLEVFGDTDSPSRRGCADRLQRYQGTVMTGKCSVAGNVYLYSVSFRLVVCRDVRLVTVCPLHLEEAVRGVADARR